MSKHNIQVGVITLGMVATNCYYVFYEDQKDENGKRHVIVFDPADAGDKIYNKLLEYDLVVDLILLTHGHFDHIMQARGHRFEPCTFHHIWPGGAVG